VYAADPLIGRILVVDDDASLREMIGTALQMRGAEVELASNLEEALRARGPFHVAVIDYLLGDQRGDGVLAALREKGTIQHGLLVTGTEVPRKLSPGGEPEAMLRKPFELNDLFERVGELLNGGARRQSRSA
jgi:DNA-binding response OmpR family regulator